MIIIYRLIIMDPYPRVGKRCKNTSRFKKNTNLCHYETTPIASHNTSSHPRTGKRCKNTFRYKKSKKLCVYSYKNSRLRKRSTRKNYRDKPLPIDQQKQILESPDKYVLYSPEDLQNNSPPMNEADLVVDSPDKSVLYSPEDKPFTMEEQEQIVESPDNSVLYSPEDLINQPGKVKDKSVLYSPDKF